MISDQEDSSDDSDTGLGGRGLSSASISARKRSASLQREQFQASRNVPSLNIESVDGDPTASISSIKGSRSRSPSPVRRGSVQLDRDSSGSAASLITDEFVVVGRSHHTRSMSNTLSKWRSLDSAQSVEDGDQEEASNLESSLTRANNFERSQLYLLVARCISYPFTARYQLENAPPKQKMTEEKLGQIVRTLKSVSAGEKVRYHDNISASELKLCKDEKYLACLRWYLEVVLQRSDVVKMCKEGSFSAKELVSIFKLGNAEEQEAVVRRELQNRKKQLEIGSPRAGESKFGSHRVEEIFRDEQLKTLKTLNSNLDQLSLSGPPTHSPAAQKKKRGSVLTESGNFTVAKQDVQFKLKVTVTIHELTDIPSNENRRLFCAFELEGCEQTLRTQEFQSSNGTIKFVQAGDFWTSSPVPQIKLTLMACTKGLMSSSKTLVKKTHVATPSSSDVYTTLNMLKNDKNSDSLGRLKISTVVERPAIMKKSGFLTANGDYLFKELKKRFFALIQLSQYKFIFTVYSPGASYPKFTMLMDQRFTVEFPTPEDELFADPNAKDRKGSMFVLVSEESEVGRIRFGCRDSTERDSWMKWLARATGQNFEPSQTDSGTQRESNDLDRYGLQEVVDSVKDITKIDPHKMFVNLFKATLEYRLTEETFSRGLFSPAQMYVMDEFCARYGVRDLFRHLTCLQNWLHKEVENVSIWPVMMLSSFRFCQMHVGGANPIEKSMIVTIDEREKFVQVCKQLEEVVSRKLLNFHSSFPYGLPKDDLKITLKLFELVATANQTTGHGGTIPPVKMLTTVMEKAALVNYKKTFSALKLSDDSVALTMAQLSELAQLCIDFMYELHDYYWEDFTQFTQVFSAHLDCFWLFFLVDAREAMSRDNSIISKLQLFHVINQYFCSQPTLKLANFHRTFLKDFTAIVSAYIDSLDQQLKGDLGHSLTLETWQPVGECCKAVEGVVQALHSFKSFIDELGWPEKSFASQLEVKVAAICAQRFHEAATEVQKQLSVIVKGSSVSLRYHLPVELMTMLNTLVHLKSQASELCLSHLLNSTSSLSLESEDDALPTEQTTPTNIDDYLSEVFHQSVSMVINALCQPMELVLSKISRHDPSDGFLATLKNMLPNTIPLDSFNQFLSVNIDLLTHHISSSVRTPFILNWYECQLQLIKQWLEERPNFSLQDIQHQSIVTLVEVLHQTYGELPNDQLESDTYTAIQDRIKMETSYNEIKAVGQH